MFIVVNTPLVAYHQYCIHTPPACVLRDITAVGAEGDLLRKRDSELGRQA